MQKTLLLFILLFFTFQLKGQKNGILGVGISGGAVNYKGDLDYDLSLKFTKPGFGIHFLLLPYSKFNFSLNYFHGKIACDDSKADDPNKYRNLNFYSDLDELSLITVFRFQDPNRSFSARVKLIPYLFGGIAVFHFNPKTKLNGIEYELEKIGTEGQHLDKSNHAYPKPYKLTQISFPFGAGIKYKIAGPLDIGLEMGLRKTLTDYLDDLSGSYPDKAELLQEEGAIAVYLSDPSNDPKRPNGRASLSNRGYSKKKDWYTYSNLSITYYFVSKIYKSRQRYVF